MEIVALSFVATACVLLQSQVNLQYGLLMGVCFISSLWESKHCSLGVSSFDLDGKRFCNQVQGSAVWLQFPSFVFDCLQRAVVKLVDRASKVKHDIWRLLFWLEVASLAKILSSEAVGVWALISEELLKDLKATTTVAVTYLETAILFRTSVLEPLMTISVVQILKFRIWKHLVSLAKLVESAHLLSSVLLGSKGVAVGG